MMKNTKISRFQKITLVSLILSMSLAYHAIAADRTVLGEIFGRST